MTTAREAIIRGYRNAKDCNPYWTDEDLADAIIAELKASEVWLVERGEWVFDGVSGVDE